MIIGASATWSTRKRRPIGIESRELQAEQRNNRTDCRGLSIKSRVPRVPSPESRVPLQTLLSMLRLKFQSTPDCGKVQAAGLGIGDFVHPNIENPETETQAISLVCIFYANYRIAAAIYVAG